MFNNLTKETVIQYHSQAIEACEKAIKAIETLDLRKKGVHIGAMQDKVIELNNAIDMNYDKKAGQELASLYDFILFKSTQANIQANKEGLTSCQDVLKELKNNFVKNL